MNMKKNLLIMASAMAVLSLGACGNEENTNGVDLSRPISLDFRPATVQTRATVGVENAVFESGDVVGVYVSSSTLAGSEYANIGFTNAGTGVWTATDLYWPSGTDTYTFTAYYPFAGTEGTAAATLPVSVPADQSGDAYTRADYLWAQQASVEPTNATIPFTLDHKMSLLKLDMKAGKDMSLSEIQGMTPAILGTIPATGTWDLVTGTVTLDAEGEAHSSLKPHAVHDAEAGTLTYYALVMPGTKFGQGARFLTLTDTDGTVFHYDLNIEGGITAAEGMYVDLNLTVNRTEISLTSFSIGDWKLAGENDGTVVME